MKIIYPAVFHTDDDGVWVEFPDLVGCNSFGDNVREALDGAREALEGYCITILEEKKALPKPCDILSVKVGANSFTTLVETDLTTQLTKQKSVKKTLTIPSWLNEAAVEKGINFSKVLQNALFDEINAN